jgi:hypothetical protein
LISILAPDYSTLSLRIPKLELNPDLDYEPREREEAVIAVDGTGIKVQEDADPDCRGTREEVVRASFQDHWG